MPAKSKLTDDPRQLRLAILYRRSIPLTSRSSGAVIDVALPPTRGWAAHDCFNVDHGRVDGVASVTTRTREPLKLRHRRSLAEADIARDNRGVDSWPPIDEPAAPDCAGLQHHCRTSHPCRVFGIVLHCIGTQVCAW